MTHLVPIVRSTLPSRLSPGSGFIALIVPLADAVVTFHSIIRELYSFPFLVLQAVDFYVVTLFTVLWLMSQAKA
jgi:hypothetical protein